MMSALNSVSPPPAPPDPQEVSAVDLCRRLQEAGFTAFFAGGCVRDRLLGRTPKDYDIATDAHPDRVVAMFPRSIEVGKAFGVVRVPVAPFFFEVATFRQDAGYSDGRRPDSVRFSDPPTDAQRRDFTINAMFFDPVAQRLHDFVGGRADLDARLIRCVGDPRKRFAEDYLRLLRAVRFAATLEFSLEAGTATALRELAAHAAEISPERVRDEITRNLLEAVRPGEALRLLHEFGLLQVLLPEVARMKGQAQPPQFHPEGDVFEHTVRMLDLMERRDLRLAWSVLLHDVGKPVTARQAEDRIRFHGHAAEGAETARNILQRLRFSNDDTDAIVACVRRHMHFQDVQQMRRSTLRRLIGSPTFETELELHRLDCLSSHGNLDHYRFLQNAVAEYAGEPVLPEPWIGGRDIMALGVPEGPEVGVWRRLAHEAQLENRFATRDELLAWLRGEITRS